MPMHPVLAGVAVGLLNQLPTSLGATGSMGGALYFGAAGATSSWVYNAFTHFMEKRGDKGAPKTLSVPPPASKG